MSKKEAGNVAYRRDSYQEAYEIYSEALTVDPINIITNAKLYCNRALMAQKLGLIEQGIADCSSAIGLDDRYIRAYQRRAKLWVCSTSSTIIVVVTGTRRTSSTRNASTIGRKCVN